MKRNFVQSARGRVGLFLCVLTGAAWIAPAQPVKSEAADVAVLRAELRRLALELLQHRAEFIQWKMHWVSAQLQQAQAERQRLGGERQAIEREIGELNLALTRAPGAEDDSRREELKGVRLPALEASERAAATREATWLGALSAANAQLTEIQKQAEHLESERRGRLSQ
jgi:hypothetical protein